MAIEIPRDIVDRILRGSPENRRQLQDSPILSDVWIEFAKKPDQALELLITPVKTELAGNLAVKLDERIPHLGAEIAPLHGIVAAKLTFEEVLRFVLPMTEWWNSERVREQFKQYDASPENPEAARAAADALNEAIDEIIALGERESRSFYMPPAIHRLIALAGLILWAGRKSTPEGFADKAPEAILAKAIDGQSHHEISEILDQLLGLVKGAGSSPKKSKKSKRPERQAGSVWLVALNRAAMPAVAQSVTTVKGDAARALFHVNCSTIRWAVVDSGVQGNHPAFGATDGSDEFRVIEAYDFSNIRMIVSLDNRRILGASARDDDVGVKARNDRLDVLLPERLLDPPTRKQAIKHLLALAEGARERRSVDWELVRPFVQIKPETPPGVSDHGTHVAGIIGARRDSSKPESDDNANGMCPDIELYDFRVLGETLKETEFALIAALQFIRHLNERTDHMTIHGANLSLSIPHDVLNYGCGRTPVCLECERLVDSGVVVVAAAGNYGYHSYATKDGSYEGYAALSITDPGNADGVITVGATHRTSPHSNGISFFSSRGPTGDGRLKPDLVAPGERIRAPFRKNWGDLDGTSMAAPHVSGAAAMLMARYSELIGQPRRIKKILCGSATDLGRERSFQGHGMLDVLRAFQSI
jgi:hypothetical protein